MSPRIDHPELRSIVDTKYVSGTIASINHTDDTCSVNTLLGIFIGVPIFYH